MAGIGSKAPPGPDDLPRRVGKLEKLVQRLAALNIFNSATIDRGGLQVINGGSFKVIDPVSGRAVAFMGQTTLQDGSGRTQMSVFLARDDGTAAFQLSDLGTTPGHAHQQALQWFDRSGRVVVADDTISGTGLAAPLIETGGLHDTNVAKWPATNSTGYVTIADGYLQVQNPRLTWQIYLYADSGITASFQMYIGSTPVGAVQTVTSGTLTTWSTNVSLPAGVSVGSTVYVALQAKTSAASGSARAQCLRLSGQSS